MYKLRVLYYFLNHIIFSFRIVMIDFLYQLAFQFCRRKRLTVCSEETFALVTIAYNNPFVIALQISCIKMFLKDSYCYFVVDNSSNSEFQERIRNICGKAGVQYIAVPKVLQALARARGGGGSYSHGIALNFASSIVTKQKTFKYIGFLDHDIYPFKMTSLLGFFKNNVVAAGVSQDRDERFYIWPGFAFFETAFLTSFPVDFRPCAGMDTGGRLYFTHYKRMEKDFFRAVPQCYEELCKDDGTRHIYPSEIIGDWFHSVNASYWAMCSPKEDDILRFVSQKANWNTLDQEVDYFLSS